MGWLFSISCLICSQENCFTMLCQTMPLARYHFAHIYIYHSFVHLFGAISGLVLLLYTPRFSKQSKEDSIILSVLNYHLGFCDIRTAEICLPFVFCINDTFEVALMCFVTRLNLFKRSTIVTIRSNALFPWNNSI